jgi:hypothetical protein
MSDNRFGPDNNLPIDSANVIRITVPAKHRAKISFNSEAYFENAIVVYEGKDLRQVHEAGNYGRSLGEFTFDNPERATHLLITGWHKNSPPAGDQPWVQSRAKRTAHTGWMTAGGFEDFNDDDFDDIAFVVTLSKL